ncbi:hypothetical protein DFAR_4000011 [Desulfarculales bacterium]
MLFAQAAMILVREMPMLAAARIIGASDTRFWRVIQFYVGQALLKMSLAGVKALALDETTSKRGHNYVIVFIDLDRKQKPSFSLPPARARAIWSCSAASCVSMAASTTILPRWSATCRQPSWPSSAKTSPSPTSPWTDSM